MDFAIIAAGEGSRLREEGVSVPKPLIEIDGVPMIERLIRTFINNGADSIAVIVHEEMAEVKQFVASMSLPVPLHLVVKTTPSSMHSFFELSSCLKGDKFCLTTVDTIFRENEFADYIRAFREDNSVDGLMAVTDYIDDEKPLYLEVDKETRRIRNFLDTYNKGIDYISGGIYCLTSPALDTLQRCMNEGVSRMRNYQRELIRDGLHLKAYPFSKILDVDHKDDIAKAESFLKS